MEAQTTLRNLPFSIEDQQIIRLGINFDSKTRNIDKVLVGRKSPHIHDIQ